MTENRTMDNELIPEKNWWKRNWKWFFPLSGFAVACIFMAISGITGLTDFAQAYADPLLYQKAIEEANKNEQVVLYLGKLAPVDQLAIMEGNSVYSNNNTTVAITVRVSGKKGKGKMDIAADKTNGKWQYKSIRIRIKKTGTEIQVLKEV